MNEKNSGEVRYKLDADNLPTMSDRQISALRSISDEDIDLSDAPPLTDQPTRRVVGPRFGIPEASFRIEADILQFFRETGDASPNRINAALREYVAAHRKSA